MSDIPDELYCNILSRVAVEDLLRLRSVCKTWRRIIDDPDFAKSHVLRGKGEDFLIVKSSISGKIYLFPLKMTIFENVPSIVFFYAKTVKSLVGPGAPRIGCIPLPLCNDLILISSCNKKMFWQIWNHFSGKSLKLGKCDGFGNDKRDIPYSGIGYGKATNDYKVVMIIAFHTYIYSVNSKVWRMIEDFPDYSFIWGEEGIFAHGALHWVTFSEGESGHRALGSIAALDLSTEKYHKVQVPSEMAEFSRYSPSPKPRLVTLSECLFICAYLSGHFVVWMIKGYGCENTWVKMISLKSKYFWTPIAYMKSKERILLHRNDYDQICCWYDLVKKCTEQNFLIVFPETDNLDKNHLNQHPFSCQVLAISHVRFMGSDDACEDVALEGVSKKKRKRTIANNRVLTKIVFGDHEGSTSGD